MQTNVRGTAIVLQDKEMEHQVVTSIIMNGVGAYYSVSSILEPKDFDIEACRLVYEAIGEMAAEESSAVQQTSSESSSESESDAAEGTPESTTESPAATPPFDILLLRRQLTDNGNLDRVGGLPMLSQFTGTSLVEDTLLRYATHLKKLSLRRTLQALGYALVEAVDDPQNSVLQLVQDTQQQLIDIEMAQAQEDSCSVCDLLEAKENYLDHFTGDEQSMSWKTGFDEVDAITNGVCPGNFVVLGGRPGEGKSALALRLATNIATINKIRTSFFTLEMSELDTMKRINSYMSEVSHDKVKAQTINTLERKRVTRAYHQMKHLQVEIHSLGALSISKAIAMIRHDVLKKQVQTVVIDYIQLLNPDKQGQQMRYAEVGEFCKRLKQLALDLDICIIGLSQLNRESSKRDGEEGKRPTNTDLRESGDLEQSADMVWLLYRPEHHSIKTYNNKDTKGKAILIISKNRDGGDGDANMAYHRSYRKFDNLNGPGLVPVPVQMRDYMASVAASESESESASASGAESGSGAPVSAEPVEPVAVDEKVAAPSASSKGGGRVIARAKSPQALGCDGPSGVKVPQGMVPEFVLKQKWYLYEEDWNS